MEPTRADRILDDWSAVTSTATPPGPPPRPVAVTRLAGGVSLAGAALLVVAVVAAVAWLGNRDPRVGGPLSATPTPTPLATATPAATPSVTPSLTPTPAPTGTPELVVCSTDGLVAVVTQWEGAAGHRIADVELTNAMGRPCLLATMDQPQLLDGNLAVLVDGEAPSTFGTITLPVDGTATTLVDVANYCGATPVAPTTVGFVRAGPTDLLVASPVSDTDTTVPPCNGPGQPGMIQMQPWRS